METINQLYEVLLARQGASLESSYTARLLQNEDEILKKVGEESVEVILAAKGQGQQRLVEEISDLTYHVLVLMVSQGISLNMIVTELKNRRK